MGICNICTQALTSVYAHQLRNPSPALNTVHAPHDQNTSQACWICQKYSIWLQDEFPETLQAWKSGPLYSVFRLSSKSLAPEDTIEGHDWPIVSLGVTIQPLGFSRQDPDLAVTIRLMSNQGAKCLLVV